MKHCMMVFSTLLAAVCVAGCGGSGSSGSGGASGSGGEQVPAPTLSNLAPSAAAAGTSSIALLAYGSNFSDDVTILWNGVRCRPRVWTAT